MQFLAFGREIDCETPATLKVTVKPLRYIPLQEQFDNFSIINIFLLAMLARFKPAWQRYPTGQSYTCYALSYPGVVIMKCVNMKCYNEVCYKRTALYFDIRMVGKFKISEILNFRNSNFKTCCMLKLLKN